jgi:hypothetical protein
VSLPSLPDVPRERRRTSTVVAVGVLALLCLLALVLGLKGLFAAPAGEPPASASTPAASTGPGRTPTPAESAAPSASPTATASPTPDDLLGFSSPSGNIRCVISSLAARCDIDDRTWPVPPKPASCDKTWGEGLVVQKDGARITCSSDSASGGKPLAYGQKVTRGDFRCDSDRDGMTCVHAPSGHGFSISRASRDLR